MSSFPRLYKDNHKSRIFIAIPAQDGFVHSELSSVLIRWTHDSNFIIGVKFYTGLSPLDNCRNHVVKEFLEEYWDYLLFIDADIVPPLNTLQKLVSADKEIIAPLCFTFKAGDDGIVFPMPVAHRYDDEGRYRPYYGKGVEETDVITGGMFLVKREVYEKMDRPFAFTYHANGTVIYSEDFYFSQQAQSIGYKLYTDYSLPCKHIKQTDVKSVNDLMVKYGRES